MAPDDFLSESVYEPLMNGEQLRCIREGLGFSKDAMARVLNFKHGGIIAVYERGYVMRKQGRRPMLIPDDVALKVKAMARKRFEERMKERQEINQLAEAFGYSRAS